MFLLLVFLIRKFPLLHSTHEYFEQKIKQLEWWPMLTSLYKVLLWTSAHLFQIYYWMCGVNFRLQLSLLVLCLRWRMNSINCLSYVAWSRFIMSITIQWRTWMSFCLYKSPKWIWNKMQLKCRLSALNSDASQKWHFYSVYPHFRKYWRVDWQQILVQVWFVVTSFQDSWSR